MEKRSRRSIRLKNYDYSQSGYYFVTVCAQARECLFGDISSGKVILNEQGKIILNCWHNLPNHYNNIATDYFAIMPNHMHMIIAVGAGLSRLNTGRENLAPTLGRIVAYFKYITTKQINELQNKGIKKIWQRNYYEHIIRDNSDLTHIREYIANNPGKWQEDEYYVEQTKVKY